MKIRSSKSFRFKNSGAFKEEKDKWVNLENILLRGGPQVGDTDFTLQIYGVYSLPEIFSKLQQSGSVDTWSYIVKFTDIQLPGGKFNARELTEEEIKEMENKKKPPPKINKKDLAAVKAEEDRIAAEQKEKEEKEKAFQDFLNKMTPEEQYYYLKEMPTKEPWLSWPEGKTISTIKKSGEKFIELEQDVNTEKGAILELQFLPPPDEDPKKRPKPKGLLPEEIKPLYAVAWIDYTKLNNTPGLTELELRAKLMTREKYEKNIDDLEKIINKKVFNPYSPEYQKLTNNNTEKIETEKKNETQKNENNQSKNPNETNDDNKDFLEKAETYIRIRIMLSQPVNPVLPDVELPEPIYFIKKEKPPKKPITTEEIEQDLIRQFKIAIAAIAKVYDEAMGESAKGSLMKREKGNIFGNVKKEDKEYISKFLDKFNTSGRADLLKEKLKKFIVRIVREKFGKKKTPVKGVYKDDRDQFYSELYSYLTDTLKKAGNEFVELKKDELHENVITPFSLSKKEIMEYITRENKEPEDKRLLRLSKENELLNDYSKAVKYYKSRLLLDPNKEAWLAYCNLTKKLEDIPEVETSLINAISIDAENCDLNLQLIFCGLLYIKGQIGHAINYLTLYILKNGLNSTNYIFNAFLSFLYKERTNPSANNIVAPKGPKNMANESLSKKYLEAAKLFKMKSLPPDELKPPPEIKVEEEEDPKKKKGKDKEKDKKNEVTEENLEELSKRGNPRLHPEFKKPVLNNAQLDSIWLETAILFNRYNFYEISEKLLENATEETKQTIDFKNEQAKVLLYRKEYEKVIELCNEIIKQKRLSYNAYILKGHALYYLNRYQEAQETYIKAIRFKPQEITFDIEMLVKLGLIYIKEQKWYDAKVIFKQIIKSNPEASYAWRYLGFALTQLSEFEEAEKALMKANTLDVENPLIWAYLTIFNLNNGKKYQALECFNELNKVNYNDVNIMKQIAKLFYDIEEYEIVKNIYYKIKEQEKTDGDCYLKIANIYNEKLSQKNEALSILKEGLDKVMDEKSHQEIEKMIKDIEKEEQDLFIGEIPDKNVENSEEVSQMKMSNNESRLKEENDNVNMENSKMSDKEEQKVPL